MTNQELWNDCFHPPGPLHLLFPQPRSLHPPIWTRLFLLLTGASAYKSLLKGACPDHLLSYIPTRNLSLSLASSPQENSTMSEMIMLPVVVSVSLTDMSAAQGRGPCLSCSPLSPASSARHGARHGFGCLRNAVSVSAQGKCCMLQDDDKS